MRVGALALALAALAACGGGKAKPPPTGPTSTPPEEVKPDLELLAGIADGLADVLSTMTAITENAPDCPAMAIQLTRLFEESAELFDLARREGADPEAGPILTAELDKRSAAVEPLVARIQKGLARCQMDPDVAAAMERMPTF